MEKCKISVFLIVFVLLILPNIFAGGQKEKPTAEGTEITIWTWGTQVPEIEGLQKKTWPLIEKEFGIKIRHEFLAGLNEPEYVMKVTNAVGFGKGPDILDGNDIILSSLAYRGFCEQVPATLNKSFQDKVLPSYAKSGYFWDKDGYKKPYSPLLINYCGARVTWWNKKLYKEEGLDHSPITWSEVIDFGKKLTKYDASGNITRSGFFFRTGGNIGGIADKWSFLFYSAGGESVIKTDANGNIKPNFNTPVGAKVCQFYLDVIYNYKIDDIGIPGDYRGLINEQTATIMREPWVPISVSQDKPDFYPNLGVGPIPVPEKGMKAYSPIDFTGFVVNKNISAKKKELIWKIFERLNQPDMVKLRSADINVWLPYKAIQDKPPFDSEIWTNYAKYNEYAVVRSEAPNFDSIQSVIGEQLNRIFHKELAIDKGLDAGAKKLMELYGDILLREK